MNKKYFYIFFLFMILIIPSSFGIAISLQYTYSTNNQLPDESSTFLNDSHPIFGTATWSDGGYANGATVNVISIFGTLIGSVNETGEWRVDFIGYETWPERTPIEVIISGCCPRWFWSGYSFGYINGDYTDLGNIVLIYNENLNHPPTTPHMIGSFSGEPDTEYIFAIESVDFENHDIYYYIDWGDNSNEERIGPFPSGEQQIINHTWDRIGIYEIKIKSKDAYNAESDWSYPMKFRLSKTKVFNSPFLTFLENHPNIFPLLQQILGLK
jgi:hypothetical protein